MSGSVKFRAFESRSEASEAAADLLAGLIKKELASSPQARASLVVSGGSTPGPCFDLLSRETLDWSRVIVVPSDERWVAGDDPDSNEGLIRGRLLQDKASEGEVLSFFRAGIDAVQAPGLIELDLMEVKQPFSASLLGMGEDGHFASLFADFKDLEIALDPDNRASCTMVQTGASPHLRISLTLSALLNSVQIVLLIFGEAKRRVFETATIGGGGYPIEALLLQTRTAVTVIWAH